MIHEWYYTEVKIVGETIYERRLIKKHVVLKSFFFIYM